MFLEIKCAFDYKNIASHFILNLNKTSKFNGQEFGLNSIMSYSYGKFWIATKEELKNVILREKLLPVIYLNIIF